MKKFFFAGGVIGTGLIGELGNLYKHSRIMDKAINNEWRKGNHILWHDIQGIFNIHDIKEMFNLSSYDFSNEIHIVASHFMNLIS